MPPFMNLYIQIGRSFQKGSVTKLTAILRKISKRIQKIPEITRNYYVGDGGGFSYLARLSISLASGPQVGYSGKTDCGKTDFGSHIFQDREITGKGGQNIGILFLLKLITIYPMVYPFCKYSVFLNQILLYYLYSILNLHNEHKSM